MKTTAKPPSAKPRRWERRLELLLRELVACGHHSPQLMELAELPGLAYRPLFVWLGYVAKSDGRVTKRDIELAENMMRALDIRGWRRRRAIRAFHKGRDSQRAPRRSLSRIRLLSLLLPETPLLVLIALCNGCYSNGNASLERVRRVREAVAAMGLPDGAMDSVLASYRNKEWITGAGRADRLSYDEACQIIGVPTRSDPQQIKLAYRRQVRHYHPDRLLSQNLSTAEFETAKARLLQLQEAWQVVRRMHRI